MALQFLFYFFFFSTSSTGRRAQWFVNAPHRVFSLFVAIGQKTNKPLLQRSSRDLVFFFLLKGQMERVASFFLLLHRSSSSYGLINRPFRIKELVRDPSFYFFACLLSSSSPLNSLSSTLLELKTRSIFLFPLKKIAHVVTISPSASSSSSFLRHNALCQRKDE